MSCSEVCRFVEILIEIEKLNTTLLCDQFPIPAANGPLSFFTPRTPIQLVVEFVGFTFEGGQNALTIDNLDQSTEY